MSALSIQPTFPIFTETDGLPLENGYIWIGTTNLDPQGNPINVYWDAALTIQAAQPIRTLNGYPSRSGTPARLYVNASQYSIRVQNKNGSLVYNSPDATERYSADLISFVGFKGQVGTVADLADDDGSDWIGFEQSGSGAVAVSAQDQMRNIVTAASFGADAVGDVTSELQAALDRAENTTLWLTPGHVYAISATLYCREGCTIEGNGATLLNNITGVGNPLQIAESNVTVQNLTIENTANNPVYTIADPSFNGSDIFINSIATTVKNTILRNITTVNSIEYAAAISGNGDCENVLIENCIVNGGKWVDCFAFEWNYRGGTAPANIIVPKNIEFVNCKALNNNQLTGYAWNYGWWISTCINVKLTNCIADYCKNGAALICGDVGSIPNKDRMAYSLENCQFVNTVYYGLDTFSADTIAPPNDRYLISVRNCYFSGYDETDSDSLGYSLRNSNGSIVIDNCEFERLYRAFRLGSFGDPGLENVKNVKIINCRFDDIYTACIAGAGVQDSVISNNQFENICTSGVTSTVDLSAIYLTYKSDKNVITGNSFGIGASTPRFYIAIVSAGTSPLKIPTGNIITGNTFLRQTTGLFNIVNTFSSEDYQCENIISGNISLAGASQGMVSGAVYFSNEGGNKVAHDNAAPVAGTFAVGDKCWNTIPSAGGTPGWVCTTAGTPGTWKAMANVAA